MLTIIVWQWPVKGSLAAAPAAAFTAWNPPRWRCSLRRTARYIWKAPRRPETRSLAAHPAPVAWAHGSPPRMPARQRHISRDLVTASTTLVNGIFWLKNIPPKRPFTSDMQALASGTHAFRRLRHAVARSARQPWGFSPLSMATKWSLLCEVDTETVVRSQSQETVTKTIFLESSKIRKKSRELPRCCPSETMAMPHAAWHAAMPPV